MLKAQDTRRDYGETRFIALGVSDGIVLRVVFAERVGDIRLISAWKASYYDRETYHKALEAHPVRKP